MSVRLFVVVMAIATVVGTGTAAAKGPEGGEIRGEGVTVPITLASGESSPPRDRLGQEVGFFALTFGEEPDPRLPGRPDGDLGPKLTITWRLRDAAGGTPTVAQDVYPYARGGPVSYMAAGQPMYDVQTTGGWFRADPNVMETLRSLGVAARATPPPRARAAQPAVVRDPSHDHDNSRLPWLAIGASLVVVLVGVMFTVLLRRRHSMVPRTT